MPVMQMPVHVQSFSELAEGNLFSLVRGLGRVTPHTTIFRKINPHQAFNARVEHWEGEGCNEGFVTINPDEDVVPLQ